MGSRLPFRRLRHSFELPAARFLVLLAGLMSRRTIWLVSGMLGRMAALVPGRSRRVFQSNMELAALPQGLEVNLWKVYRNMLAGILDTFHLGWRPDCEFRRAVEVRGGDNIGRALSLGRGAIAVTAHYSAWELIPRAVALQGHSVGVVSRKVGSAKAYAFLRELRAAHGTAVIERSSGIRGLMGALRRNTAVGILIDQDTLGAESGFVRFLGLPSRTPAGPARLALRFGIPVLTLHISRERCGRYIVEIDCPVDLQRFSADMHLELTAELTGRIEEWIRDDPEQWVWIHERWARRPDGSSVLRRLRPGRA